MVEQAKKVPATGELSRGGSWQAGRLNSRKLPGQVSGSIKDPFQVYEVAPVKTKGLKKRQEIRGIPSH